MTTTNLLRASLTRTAASVVLFGALGSAFAQYTPAIPSSAKTTSQGNVVADLLIIDCSGRYIKVSRTVSGPMETGTLPIATANGFAVSRLDGCLVDAVQSLRSQSALVTIAARDRVLDPSGKRRYSVVSFDLSTLKQKSTYDIPVSQSEAPRLVLSTSGKSVHIVYSSNQPGKAPLTVDRLDASTMVARATDGLDETAAKKISSSENISIDDGGNIKIDSTPIDSYSSASTNVTALKAIISHWSSRLAAESSSSKGNQDKPKFAYAGSSAGIAVYIAGWDMSKAHYQNGAILAYDLVNQAVIGGFRTDFRLAPFDGTLWTPTVHLSPNGTTVIIEAYEWVTFSGNQGVRSKTGELVAYDIRTGTLLGRVKLTPAPAQSGRVIGFAEGGKTMLYTSKEKFFAIDIASMTIASSADLPTGFEPVAAVYIR